MPVDQVIPPGLRPPLAELTFDPVDIAEAVPRDQGELRRLPLYTIVPRAVPVTWGNLTQAELDTWFEWFEDDVQAGGLQFDLQLERLGGPGAGLNPRLTWWTAQFISPPEVTVRAGRYAVTANLLLIGEPFDARVAPGIVASGRNRHRGGAVLAGAPGFAVSGNNRHRGGARFPTGTSWFVAGGNAHRGGWLTDIEP